MQYSQMLVPFVKNDRHRNDRAFNKQGRCWKSKHSVRHGNVVPTRARHQHYPIDFTASVA